VVAVDDKPRLTLLNDSGLSDARIEFPANSTNDNSWHLLTATYDFATETMTGYIDGRDVTAASTVRAGTNGSINTTQNPTDFTIGSLISSPTTFDWNGQLQQPLIYEGIWTAAQVRDLYLQQVDDIPTTYGWFLDGDTASGLTSSSPALAPVNSPDLFESDEIGGGNWLNEKGWNGAAEFNGTSSTIDFGDLSGVLQSITFDFFTDAEITSASSANAVLQCNSGSASLIVLGAWTGLLTDEIIATGDTSSERTAVVAGDLSSISAGWHTLKMEWNATAGYYEFTLDDVTYPSTAGTSGHVSGRISLSQFSVGRSTFSGQLRNLVVESDAGVLLNSGLTSDSVDTSGNGNNGTDTNVAYVPVPKRWDEELDSGGNAADNSESFGVARRDGQLEDGACLEFTGTEYATNANLVGTETVTSSGGTSTPSISAGRIDFTAGTCWGLTLSNGSIYPLGEGAGTVAYDVVNDEPLVLVNSPDWGNQSQYFWNENQGCDVVGTFDGVDDYVSLPLDSFTDAAGSIEIAFTTGSDVTGNTSLFGFSNGGGVNEFVVLRILSSKLNILDTTSNSVTCNTTILSPNTYYTAKVTTSGDAYSFEIDGVPQATSVIGLNRGTWFADLPTNMTCTFGAYIRTSARNFFEGYISSVVISDETSAIGEWDFKDGSGLTVVDRIGTNDGTINGATSDEFWGTIIPAASDGTSLIRSAPSNPAGPWLYEGLGDTYVNFDVVANANQWLEQRWIDASFNGTTSRIAIPADLISVARDCTITCLVDAEDTTNSQFIGITASSSNKIAFELVNADDLRIAFDDGATADGKSEINVLINEVLISVDWDGTAGDYNSATIDGVAMSGSAVASRSSAVGAYIGTASTGGIFGAYQPFTGDLRGFRFTDQSVEVLNTPLLGCSLDLSSQVNHGTDTDVVYNRLTDISYKAGDTVEQPFSVSTTGNKVYDLVKFTFPVTNLSSTPTISQIIYEDGNTITEDSIPIYES